MRLGLVLAVILTAAAAAAAASPGRLLAPLADQAFGEGDCGCTLRHARKNVFVCDADTDQNQARIHVGGRDVVLTRQGVVDSGHDHVGERFRERWSGPGVSVQIDYEVTRSCEHARPGEDCESIDVAATIEATAGERHDTIKATGSCGC